MYFQINGEKITGMSPAKENLKSAVEGALPKGFDHETHTLNMFKWDGKNAVWKTQAELEAIEEVKVKAEKDEEFKSKTGFTPEAFSVIMAVEKIVNGKKLTNDDKLKLTKFINTHNKLYKEII